MEGAAIGGRVRAWLAQASPLVFGLWASSAAFTTYFCMYGYRKAFSAAQFRDLEIGGLDLKIALVISQVLGYTLAKYLGIKFLSELFPERRSRALLVCVGTGWLALILYAFVPRWAMVLLIFVNGLALGGVWGLVYGFLEGRRLSDVLGAALCCSFIVASAVAKYLGGELLLAEEVWGIPIDEASMPAVVGAVYLPVFLLSVWALDKLPPPSQEDVVERVERSPMGKKERRAFVSRFLVGLVALFACYTILTVFRDYRDNFAVDIWAALGREKEPEYLWITELPIPILVLAALGLLYLVKDSRRAFFATHLLVIAGAAVTGLSTLLFDAGLVGDIVWVSLSGVGLFLAYVPFNCILFDRMIAAMGTVATAVFLIYVADALGYSGAIGVMLYKDFGHAEISHLQFFRVLSYVVSIACAGSMVLSWVYFARQHPRREPLGEECES